MTIRSERSEIDKGQANAYLFGENLSGIWVAKNPKPAPYQRNMPAKYCRKFPGLFTAGHKQSSQLTGRILSRNKSGVIKTQCIAGTKPPATVEAMI
jgi:hypothetical protein